MLPQLQKLIQVVSSVRRQNPCSHSLLHHKPKSGFIYLIDRKKDIIITGGENIYPAEIEEILHGHPRIYDVAVTGIPDEILGEIFLAIIAPKPGETLTEAEVIVFCEQNLAKHIRPRRIVFDKVPRNPTGKIEKPKLRQKFAANKLIRPRKSTITLSS